MRLLLTLSISVFLSTQILAQQAQPTPEDWQEMEQEIQRQLQELQSIFGESNMLFDTMMFKSFGFGDMENFQNLDDFYSEEFMEEFGDNGLLMPQHFDMETMMRLLEESMQGSNGNLEELFAPFFGNGQPFFPTPNEEEAIIKGEDGKPLPKSKKKKTYKL